MLVIFFPHKFIVCCATFEGSCPFLFMIFQPVWPLAVVLLNRCHAHILNCITSNRTWWAKMANMQSCLFIWTRPQGVSVWSIDQYSDQISLTLRSERLCNKVIFSDILSDISASMTWDLYKHLFRIFLYTCVDISFYRMKPVMKMSLVKVWWSV